MTGVGHGQSTKRPPLRSKTVIVVAALMAVGCIAIGGIVVMLCRATHKEVSYEDQMRRLILQLGVEETYIGFADALLYRTDRRSDARREVLSRGRQAVPFLIEGLHHENGHVRYECTCLLIAMPTKQGITALFECLWEDKKPVPFPGDLHLALRDMTRHTGGLDLRGFHDPDTSKVREIWGKWWQEHKDRLVETWNGIGLAQDDGTVIHLPRREKP